MIKIICSITAAAIVLLLPTACIKSASTAKNETHKGASLSPEKRAEILLSKMTLEEKIGQMTQMCQSNITLDGSKALNLKPEALRPLIVDYGIGSILSGSGKAEGWVDFITGVQKMALEETRLGIPIIYGMDHVHGADYVDEGTIFPHNLLLSCSFDPEVVRAGARVTTIESADLGHVWNFAPVLDIGKNPVWPRHYETFGEDPLVCGTLGTAFIQAVQQCEEIAPYKVAACAKHFIGYSDPKSGWDRTASEIPMQIIYEQFVPSFKMAIDSGVKTFMINSGELNGEPVHASKRLLTGMLRNELGFKGVVVSDIKDIMKIVEMHAGAVSEKEATAMSVNAGVDMYMACNTTYFCDNLKELVKENKVSMQRIDEAVLRILTLKFDLGLFENPYPSKQRLDKIGSTEHKTIATDAARESLVLLKNNNDLLPLGKLVGKKILVAGMSGNSKRQLMGPWTFEWMGAEESRMPADMHTLFTALQSRFPGATVEFVDSAFVEGSRFQINFMDKARTADVIILAIGEEPYSEFKGDILDLNMSHDQVELVKKAKASGKPVITVLVEGRPRVIRELQDFSDAIIFAGLPGVGGGDALADLIAGNYNPSGKLSFTYPQAASHWAPYYHKVSEYHHREGRPGMEHYFPTFPFGAGLSYTTFSYGNLQITDTVLTSTGTLKATVTVTNTGKMAGKETVLWYIRDEVGTLTRPVKQLHKFEKVLLQPGESKKLEFEIIPSRHLSYPDHTGKKITEPGYFTLTAGTEKVRFELKGK